MTKAKSNNIQSFSVADVPRAKINFADYNPREISDQNRKELKRQIKKRGLMEPLVWNKRTGNLVSGHQRLSVIDELQSDNKFSLTVAVVDLSEKEEKEANLMFNNLSLQGEFDMEMLAQLKVDGEPIDLREAGFNMKDIDFIKMHDISAYDDNESLDSIIDEFESIKEQEKAIKNAEKSIDERTEEVKQIKENARTNTTDLATYINIICKNRSEKINILKIFNKELDQDYIAAETLLWELRDNGDEVLARVKEHFASE